MIYDGIHEVASFIMSPRLRLSSYDAWFAVLLVASLVLSAALALWATAGAPAWDVMEDDNSSLLRNGMNTTTT